MCSISKDNDAPARRRRIVTEIFNEFALRKASDYGDVTQIAREHFVPDSTVRLYLHKWLEGKAERPDNDPNHLGDNRLFTN
jgi:hypothetical protein